MGNKQNSCTSNYSTWIQLRVTAYFPGNTQVSIWHASDRYIRQWLTKPTLQKTFVTLTECKNLFSDVYFTLHWSYNSICTLLWINSHHHDLVHQIALPDKGACIASIKTHLSSPILKLSAGSQNMNSTNTFLKLFLASNSSYISLPFWHLVDMQKTGFNVGKKYLLMVSLSTF